MEPTIVAVVLCGGASRRMGTDKALVAIDGVPMLARVIDALEKSGAAEVVLVGDRRLSVPVPSTVTWIPDSSPGAGPLGGLVDGLALLNEHGVDDRSVVLVVACDHPALDHVELRSLAEMLDGVDHVDAVVPVVEERSQPMHAAYRLGIRSNLAVTFASGERSLLRALERSSVEWPQRTGASYLDVDDPASLASFRARFSESTDPRDPESPGNGTQEQHRQ